MNMTLTRKSTMRRQTLFYWLNFLTQIFIWPQDVKFRLIESVSFGVCVGLLEIEVLPLRVPPQHTSRMCYTNLYLSVGVNWA